MTFSKKLAFFQTFFAKPLDILDAVWYNIYRKEVINMKKKKKLTPYEKAIIIVASLQTIAAFINAIRWW